MAQIITPLNVCNSTIQQQQLSIDSLRNNNAGNNLGNVCGGTQNALPTDWEIPLNGKNFLFTSNNSTGNVGIGGYSCGISDKLAVTGSTAENNTGLHITNVTNAASSSAYLNLTNDIAGNNALITYHSSTYSSPSLFELSTPADIDLRPAYSANINLRTAGGLVNVNGVNSAYVPANTSLAVHQSAVIENGLGYPAWMRIMNGSNPLVYLGTNNSYGQLDLYDASAASTPLVSVTAFPGQHTWFNNGAFVGIRMNNPGVALDVNGTIRGVAFATSDSTLKTNITPLSGSALGKVKDFRAVSYD